MRRSDDIRGATSQHKRPSEPLTGRCDHCEWHTVQGSYSEMVKVYQDHLREQHHKVWVRT